MPESKVDLTKIPSSVVGFDKPYCFKHDRAFRVENVNRHYDHVRSRLTVTRYCICKQCQAEGKEEFTEVVNSKDFDV